MTNEHTIANSPRSSARSGDLEHLQHGERGREFERLAAAYSWDMRIDEARHWPYRLIRRVMDVGTLDDIVSMEAIFGREELAKALATAEAGALRPKSWTFWHYRLGLVPPGATCPPMPARRAA
jgi:hypothetical protein